MLVSFLNLMLKTNIIYRDEINGKKNNIAYWWIWEIWVVITT